MDPILSPEEWMIRCLMDFWHLVERQDVFIRAYGEQNMSGGMCVAIVDYARYKEDGNVPAYVQGAFMDAFPWNKRDNAISRLLAAE